MNMLEATPDPDPVNRGPGRPSRPIDYGGRSLSLAGWSRETGIPVRTIYSRLAGASPWSVGQALGFEPRVPTGARLITHEGVTRTLTEWARETGLTVMTIFGRLRAGHSESVALGFEPLPTTRKLSWEQAREIRSLRAAGKKLVVLAERYRITPSMVSLIASGKRFASVTEAVTS